MFVSPLFPPPSLCLFSSLRPLSFFLFPFPLLPSPFSSLPPTLLLCHPLCLSLPPPSILSIHPFPFCAKTNYNMQKAREKLLTLNLPEYTLQLLSDKQANKKYCVELRNCVTDEYIWFAANDGDKFDKWVTILLPATYHPEEDDEEPEIPEAVPHSPIEKENATGTEVALRNKVDTLTSGEVVLRRNKTRTVTMSVRRPITGRFQDLVLNYEEGEAQCEDDSPKKPEQKTESEESLKRPELKHNPAPEISPPPSP